MTAAKVYITNVSEQKIQSILDHYYKSTSTHRLGGVTAVIATPLSIGIKGNQAIILIGEH